LLSLALSLSLCCSLPLLHTHTRSRNDENDEVLRWRLVVVDRAGAALSTSRGLTCLRASA